LEKMRRHDDGSLNGQFQIQQHFAHLYIL
jgi:hypothetical protein